MDISCDNQEINANLCTVLQVLGTKWGFVVIAELSKGPRRFKELQRNLVVVKTQSLTDTLRLLEQNGLVLREVFPTVPVTVQYSLTEKGNDFQSVLREMNRWAVTWAAQTQEASKLL